EENRMTRQTAGGAGWFLRGGRVRLAAIETHFIRGNERAKRTDIEGFPRTLRAAPADAVGRFIPLAGERGHALEDAFAVAVAAPQRLDGHDGFLAPGRSRHRQGCQVTSCSTSRS